MLHPDPEYTRERDALIPEAEEYANKRIKKEPSADWSRVFLRKMNRLWKKRNAEIKADYKNKADDLRITFNGMQERFQDNPLPMFTDSLVTNSTFMVPEGSTIEAELERVRKKFRPEDQPAEDSRSEVSRPPKGAEDKPKENQPEAATSLDAGRA